MRRASRLTRGSTRIVTVDSIFVAIVLVPHMFAPLESVRERLFWISNFTAVGLTHLLSELQCSGRAIFYACTACHTLLFVNVCAICRCGHVRCVEKLRRTQCVTNLDVAIANCKNLVFTVNVGDLVHETVVLRPLQYLHCLVISDIVTSACLTTVVSHISNADTPILIIICTTFV